ncbi:hypothetical protein DTL70_28080 [Streptomyces diacarni]|uniref:Uncharacterized protein n=1 Tax=Streptomyces diacarni TaxID=2800381 RepID=A0A367EGX2_9ACTN|nr:hypothetical protein DTL70_28080 [Streptomyces diacarni]
MTPPDEVPSAGADGPPIGGGVPPVGGGVPPVGGGVPPVGGGLLPSTGSSSGPLWDSLGGSLIGRLRRTTGTPTWCCARPGRPER